MAKNLFRPMEIVNLTAQKVQISAPVFEVEEDLDDLQDLDEYTGPTADDLRREAEAFKLSWEDEKQGLITRAQEDADRIRKEAEETAFEEVRRKTDQASREKIEAENEAARILEQAKSDVDKMISEARHQVSQIEEEARKKGEEAGREEGFQEGHKEAERLIERLHVIIDKAIEKREDMINEAETQMIDLVLLISRKVIKVISENQKNVVVNNIVQALRKLKSRGDVAVRVNLADLDLATDHTRDFMKMVENVKSITILEDTSVDPGGCIIETDFGQIDARITSQLKEIEEKIMELVPIKVKGEQ
ncbi:MULTISPECIES: flagellar assembly protein FliH [unclassified Oceanispirochaeta]|uniref:flagellar assembly protein FliH n=1 Tax=unclassified Oceanispirochaeta TaxID=2635722 RepID=UPI000E096556|nr:MULTISPECIES: flagellar assembly protein FliH [unclassified Oceanispirochaeta]MBF9016152.1 flagellar assembly protein FliH [Oceanispirochaeta sp. M2]NPD72614.1 flagellar assembly protein FliH [Oceanispirochaeta sp. M1]RDG31766.1 flagellar assembly protein FliH [Oceanispirochaeta sp. M1]